MQIRRAVHDMSTVVGERPSIAGMRLPWMPSLLAVLVAISIAVAAFHYGDQPVFGDALGYYDYGKLIATVGPKAFASEIRTYGYPALLAGVMLVVGQDIADVQLATFVLQLGLLIGAAWIGARRIEGALGRSGIGQLIFVVTVANPFLLLYTVQLLTDLSAAVFVYLAVVLSLPQRRPESASRVTLLAAFALLCAGFAIMLRPTGLLVAPLVVGIWGARAVIYRDVPWTVLPVGVLALGLPFVPQAWSNARAFGVAHPLVVSNSAYWDNVLWGLMYVKYVTLAIPDVTNSLYYENPFRPPLDLAIGEMAWQHPGALLATVAVHAFALFDQDFPFAFVREIDPWYRWPLSVLNYVFLLGAFVGIAIGLRGTARQPAELLRRQRFTVLAFTLAVLALCAVILPTKIEGRYALPFYLLLAPPFVLAAVQVYAAVPTAGPLRLSLGAVAVAVWVGIAAAGSIWVQNQAPVLVTLRGGTVSPGAAAAQEASPAPIPSTGPTAAAQPTPEIPSARYVVDLPREMGISTGTMLDVTVTNTGREPWNVRAPYPVNVSARFIAQNTALHQRVKGLLKDSQAVQLPGDVAPGASATVRLRILAPPVPGRYTLMVHVTRLGVPDSATNVERVVRVVD